MLKLIILFIVAAAAVFIGKWGWSDQHAVHLFAVSGYWFITVNCIGFVYFLYESFRKSIAHRIVDFDWKHLLTALIIVGGSVLFVSGFEPAGFKTVMDEHMIASTSQGLHLKREATVSMRLDYVNDRPVLMDSLVDKRPIFFPYLVSVVHDVFGYHPENSIRLNVYVLCPLLFVLLYVLGCRLGGAWGGGVLCLLVATIPLCSFIFRGGGLELLNFVMLVAVLLLAMEFWEEPNAQRCGALCLGATLLAQTRYESVIFIVPVALLCVLHWWRARRLLVYWPLFITPLFLVPYLWQHRVFSLRTSNWQLEGKARPFGLEYLADNFERSILYFFNFNETLPNSWLLAGFGLIAGAWLLMKWLRRGRGLAWEGQSVPLLVYLLAYVGLYGLLLCYSWDFGGQVVQRLCLPLYLPLGLLIVVFVECVDLSRRTIRLGLVGLLLVYVVGYAYPVSSMRHFETGVGWKEFALIQSMFEAEELDGRAIHLTENPSFYSIYGYPCMTIAAANANQQSIAGYLARSDAHPLYTVLRLYNQGDSVGYVIENFTRLDPGFVIDPVWESELSTDRKIVFCRILDVKADEAVSNH